MSNVDGLLELYGLSDFADKALLVENVQLATEWSDYVVLTEEGKRCLKHTPRCRTGKLDDEQPLFSFSNSFTTEIYSSIT